MAGQILSLDRLLTPAALTHLVTTAATQLSDHRQGHTETVSVTQMVNTTGERGERGGRGGRERGGRGGSGGDVVIQPGNTWACSLSITAVSPSDESRILYKHTAFKQHFREINQMSCLSCDKLDHVTT